MGKACVFPKSHAFFGAQKYAGGGARKGDDRHCGTTTTGRARAHALGEAGKNSASAAPGQSFQPAMRGIGADRAAILRGAAARMAGRPAQRRAAVTHRSSECNLPAGGEPPAFRDRDATGPDLPRPTAPRPMPPGAN